MAESQGKPESQDIPRTEIFKSIATEAAGFYGLIITIASSFLGGTLIFIERIAPQPSPSSVVWLILGWSCLVLSIFGICVVRLINLESGRSALEGKYPRSQSLDRIGRWCSWCGVVLLGLGIGFTLMFGLVNVGTRAHNEKETHMASEKPIGGSTCKPITKSIPYGSTGPLQSAPQPTLPPASPPGLTAQPGTTPQPAPQPQHGDGSPKQ